MSFLSFFIYCLFCLVVCLLLFLLLPIVCLVVLVSVLSIYLSILLYLLCLRFVCISNFLPLLLIFKYKQCQQNRYYMNEPLFTNYWERMCKQIMAVTDTSFETYNC